MRVPDVHSWAASLPWGFQRFLAPVNIKVWYLPSLPTICLSVRGAESEKALLSWLYHGCIALEGLAVQRKRASTPLRLVVSTGGLIHNIICAASD